MQTPQPTTVRIPKDLKLWLEKLARREHRSFSAMLVLLLDEQRKQISATDKMLGQKL